MKTYSRSLLIAVAAFAVTTTGAYAHGGLLKRLELSDEQRAALHEAHELRQSGDLSAARDVLLAAGFDEVAVSHMREVAEKGHLERHEAFLATIENELTDEQLDALEVAKSANDRETVHAILEEAGVENPHEHHRPRRHFEWRFEEEEVAL